MRPADRSHAAEVNARKSRASEVCELRNPPALEHPARQTPLAEENLREGALRLRSTLDSLMEGCQIIGFDWRYSYINPTAARQGRKRQDELIGRAMMEAYPGIERTELFAVLRECMEKRIARRMENEFTFADGSNGLFELRIEPVPEGIFILSNDITDGRRAERRERLQYATTRILAESAGLPDAAPKLLQAVCEINRWDFGELWGFGQRRQELHLVETSQAPGGAYDEFAAITRTMTFPRGAGLPGRIWATRRPEWIPDMATDTVLRRRAIALNLGLKSAFGFPILLKNEVLGVMDFFGHDLREPETDLTGAFLAIGSQVGQFIERKRAEADLVRHAEQLRLNNEELTRFNRVAVGRELRMIELKKEVNELCARAGQPPRYPLEFEKEP
jgi:hypothetical protein